MSDAQKAQKQVPPGVICWESKGAFLENVHLGQNKQNEPTCRIKMNYYGGTQSIQIPIADSEKFRPLEGKYIDVTGTMYVEEVSFGAQSTTRVNFKNLEVCESSMF